MKILSAAILIACVPLTTASAQPGNDASYFCTEEVSGGLAYDVRMKKWKGTALNTNRRFVLRLKFLRTRFQTVLGSNAMVHDYDVTITDAGSNTPQFCEHHDQPVTVIAVLGWLNCNADPFAYSYKFNLGTNRFISAYLFGYADGIDANENTPSISGGTCTKID